MIGFDFFQNGSSAGPDAGVNESLGDRAHYYSHKGKGEEKRGSMVSSQTGGEIGGIPQDGGGAGGDAKNGGQQQTNSHPRRDAGYMNDLMRSRAIFKCVPVHYRDKPGSVVALASFPGSGNTWLRYLLQLSTGMG